MYRVRQENSLLEIDKRAALGSTSQCSHCCPLIHFLWVILLPNSVFIAGAYLPLLSIPPLPHALLFAAKVNEGPQLYEYGRLMDVDVVPRAGSIILETLLSHVMTALEGILK